MQGLFCIHEINMQALHLSCLLYEYFILLSEKKNVSSECIPACGIIHFKGAPKANWLMHKSCVDHNTILNSKLLNIEKIMQTSL